MSNTNRLFSIIYIFIIVLTITTFSPRNRLKGHFYKTLLASEADFYNPRVQEYLDQDTQDVLATCQCIRGFLAFCKPPTSGKECHAECRTYMKGHVDMPSITPCLPMI
ncbi:hypothetical protein ILUMI_03563 [Ignelater luminosus]|uniref:Uncharacterized protein n=1 Tax=Ignelater luminosus TaxID=2038154 RepID=A0A8K0DEB1_IGNLU|nr:hypothetical protein ILUMI_03563 [Ignelater luminosus]